MECVQISQFSTVHFTPNNSISTTYGTWDNIEDMPKSTQSGLISYTAEVIGLNTKKIYEEGYSLLLPTHFSYKSVSSWFRLGTPAIKRLNELLELLCLIIFIIFGYYPKFYHLLLLFRLFYGYIWALMNLKMLKT